MGVGKARVARRCLLCRVPDDLGWKILVLTGRGDRFAPQCGNMSLLGSTCMYASIERGTPRQDWMPSGLHIAPLLSRRWQQLSPSDVKMWLCNCADLWSLAMRCLDSRALWIGKYSHIESGAVSFPRRELLRITKVQQLG